MLKSFDFLDPTIASKIRTLEKELQRVKQSMERIRNDPSVLPATKSKLMHYQ